LLDKGNPKTLILVPTISTRTNRVFPISKWGKFGGCVPLLFRFLGRRILRRLNSFMLVFEIIADYRHPPDHDNRPDNGELSLTELADVAVRVSKANHRASSASATYQARLRAAAGRVEAAMSTAPGPSRIRKLDAAQAARNKARQSYQDAMRAIDASRRSALKAGAMTEGGNDLFR